MSTTENTTVTESKIETRGVLAGAYKGGRASLKVTLTHAIGVDANGWDADKTLCGRIDGDRLADSYAGTDEDLAAAPTCPVCLRRDPRHKR